MPLEILWDDLASVEDDFDCRVMRVRFRRPQLIDPAHVASVFRELFDYYNKPHGDTEMMEALLKKDFDKIAQGVKEKAIEPVIMTDNHFACLVSVGLWKGWPRQLVLDQKYGETISQEPSYLSADKKLSTRKRYSFPLRIIPSNQSTNCSSISVIHNVPLTKEPIMGSCTWSHYTQLSTTIELKIDRDWLWSLKGGKENKEVQQIAGNLYWLFQDWVNKSVLVQKLTTLGYDLVPQFDPTWTDYVIEDQCQKCGRIIPSMPFKRGDFKLGKTSINICNCRCRKSPYEDGFYPAIQRRFKIIGVYPISPQEAEIALCEAAIWADSVD